MLILYLYFIFNIFQSVLEILNAIFQDSVYVTIVTNIVYYNLYHREKDFSFFISSIFY